MFGLEYVAGLIKIAWRLGFSIVSALLYKPAWNCVASNYLSEWIPERFCSIPFWHIVAFLIVIGYVSDCLGFLAPSVKVENSSK